MKTKLAILGAPVAAYFAARALFQLTGAGLIAPSGAEGTIAAVLGALAVLLRLVSLFAVPPLATYWALTALASRFNRA